MGSEFQVITYNVGNGRADPARLVELLRTCGADVVALQELSHSQADEIENKLPYYFPHRSMFPGGFAGKAVLSRYPILKAVQAHLGPERPDLMVKLAIEGVTISVIAAHPPPPRLHRTGFHFDHPTLGQIRALAALAVDNSPALLVGDFNLVDLQQEYHFLLSLGLQDAFQVSGRGFGYTLPRRVGSWRRFQLLNRLISWIPLIPVARVDYIWYTNPLECRSSWVGKDAGSDHLPVLAKFYFPG